jgi:hypothetical protein
MAYRALALKKQPTSSKYQELKFEKNRDAEWNLQAIEG